MSKFLDNPNFEVGQVYESRDGKERATISKIYTTSVIADVYNFHTGQTALRSYDLKGSWSFTHEENSFDLVKLLGKQIEPAKLLQEGGVTVTSDDEDLFAVPEHHEVHNPSHYTTGQIECIDAIKAALTPEEFRGYCKGNMIKYVWRERHKQGPVSIEKALWYGSTLLQEIEQ